MKEEYPLLERELSSAQIRAWMGGAGGAGGVGELKRELGRYGSWQAVAGVTAEGARALRSNYQGVIGEVARGGGNANDLSMHLLLTLHLYFRALGQPAQAKEALVRSLPFLANAHSDPLLRGICFNHLAHLYKSRGKPWKAARFALQGVEVVQLRLQTAPRAQRQEVATLLVVLLLFARNSLAPAMRAAPSRALRHYFDFVNYLGDRTCVKYLGRESVFNKFQAHEHFHLPVFRTHTSDPRDAHSGREAEIISQLEKIHEILKSKQRQDAVEGNASVARAELPEQSLLPAHEQPPTPPPEAKPKEGIPQQKSHTSLPSTNPNRQEKQDTSDSKQDRSREDKPLKNPKDAKRERQERHQRIQEEKPSKAEDAAETRREEAELNKEEASRGERAEASRGERAEASRGEKEVPNFIMQLFRPFASAKDAEISVPKITINQQSIDHNTSHHYVPSSDSDNQPVEVIAEQTFTVGKWEVRARLLRGQEEEGVGSLQLESSGGGQGQRVRVGEEAVEKLLSQINKEDCVPYEMLHEQLEGEECLESYVRPFLALGEGGRLSILPHAPGLLAPFPIKFLGQECFVFLNHVRHNLFRIAIAPAYSCKSIYLNVELSQETMGEYFSFEEETIDFLNAIFASINNTPAAAAPERIKDRHGVCRVVSEQSLLRYVGQLVVEFEVCLLTREDETAVNEIIENELLYYKYEEVSVNRLGIFYFIRYLPSINHLDLYLKNNYDTYGIDGRLRSRGTAQYRARDFLQDFGIPLKAARHNLFAFLEIIAKKYYLLTFDKPLTDHDHDRYDENAILELPLTENCFRSRLFRREGYFLPVTISLLAVNAETPVGIKVVEYDPLTSRSRGYFIHVVPHEWARPYRKPAISINTVLFHNYITEFPFRAHYFLPDWLERTGFDALFRRLMDPRSALSLDRNVNALIRGRALINIFNHEKI